MKPRYKLMCVVLPLTFTLQAQSTIDQVLASVLANNKTIQAESHRMEASRALFQTGLALPDPEVTLDWMKGFPSVNGYQTDLTAFQSFDFPTVYKYQRQVANLKTEQTIFESDAVRTDILLEAKLIALHLVYLNKRKAELLKRLVSAEKFYADYQIKLEQQDATILDANKAKLQLLNSSTDLQLVEADIARSLQKLTELNGGNPVVFIDTLYPPLPALADFEALEEAIEAADPTLKYLQAQHQIGQTEVLLSKARLLPKFEAGYRYQGISEQQFHGIHAGVSVPIWENKKLRNYATLQIQLYDARIEEHRTEHYYESRRLYEQYLALRASFNEYQDNLQLNAGVALLDTALQAGQITALEYFLEITMYYESMDRYLELEEMQQRVGAVLLKFITL